MTPDDLRGRRPVIRMVAAVSTCAAFTALLIVWIMPYIAPPEPNVGRVLRYALIPVLLASVGWSIRLYVDYLHEPGPR